MSFRRMTSLVCLAGAAAVANCQESNDDDGNTRVRLIGDYASQLVMISASDPDSTLELRDQPLLYWTNPTRSDAFGGIYLWTYQKRPMAIAGIFVRVEESEIHATHEFHSLTQLPLSTKLGDKEIWAPTVPGAKFLAFAGSKPPATSATTRLRQIKNIAAQFSIAISWPRAEPATLRVLTKPIYRYSHPESGLIDGAIIAFAQGTDPEALLLVEARSGSGVRQWQYAIVRCTNWAVKARLDEKVVFDVPVARRDTAQISSPYHIVRWTKAK